LKHDVIAPDPAVREGDVVILRPSPDDIEAFRIPFASTDLEHERNRASLASFKLMLQLV
jgi:hypothetical protein